VFAEFLHVEITVLLEPVLMRLKDKRKAGLLQKPAKPAKE
jgi:hypothetical protein